MFLPGVQTLLFTRSVHSNSMVLHLMRWYNVSIDAFPTEVIMKRNLSSGACLCIVFFFAHCWHAYEAHALNSDARC